MLWIKAFHIVFVASWFAALFYAPRILVNLAQVGSATGAGSDAERLRLLGMGRRLLRFGWILAVPALGLGAVLWLYFGIGVGQSWMYAKLFAVVLTLGYHHGCDRLLVKFERHANTRSHVWFRWFNEASVLLFTVVVILVVVKPSF